MFFIIIGIFLILLGFLSNFFPILPGGILFSYISLVFLYLSERSDIGIPSLVFFGIITFILMILENVMPVMTAKSRGATKGGLIGAGIGAFLGIFIIPPIGIILGVLFGSIIGELISNQNLKKALDIGVWSFMGYFIAMILKIIFSGVILFYFIANLF